MQKSTAAPPGQSSFSELVPTCPTRVGWRLEVSKATEHPWPIPQLGQFHVRRWEINSKHVCAPCTHTCVRPSYRMTPSLRQKTHGLDSESALWCQFWSSLQKLQNPRANRSMSPDNQQEGKSAFDLLCSPRGNSSIIFLLKFRALRHTIKDIRKVSP